MSIIIHLPQEMEAKLAEQARASGKDVAALASEAVQEQLTSGDPTPTPEISTSQWLRLFDAWVVAHESRNPRLDDSRDSIYPDFW